VTPKIPGSYLPYVLKPAWEIQHGKSSMLKPACSNQHGKTSMVKAACLNQHVKSSMVQQARSTSRRK